MNVYSIIEICPLSTEIHIMITTYMMPYTYHTYTSILFVAWQLSWGGVKKLTYDPEDEQVINHLQRRAHGVFLAFVVDQRVQVEQQQEGEVGGAVDDELDEGRVDDLAHTGAWRQKVTDRKQRPKHRHAQHRGHL